METKYERLIRKSDLCIEAAMRSPEDMRKVWLGKAADLVAQARGLSLEDAASV
jgi:hypothetical protein